MSKDIIINIHHNDLTQLVIEGSLPLLRLSIEKLKGSPLTVRVNIIDDNKRRVWLNQQTTNRWPQEHCKHLRPLHTRQDPVVQQFYMTCLKQSNVFEW